MKFKLTKLSDDIFNKNGLIHPNLILEGMYWIGHFDEKPKVGERFKLGTRLDHPRDHLLTSVVTKIISDSKFKTKNSTYKLEKL